ncbi:hypothetical protein [uncultured Nonlabens sp.]|jgi:hypothetical protein|uniref:hypothetical protein n=1 Tax=uncultured Nonlabens sp. TaxID=859306 RepID=UPI0030D9F065|tara:strand:- start:101 stop:490 length:390 start_codon:yes stop_codon:yes gene_type:complete
MLVSTAKYIILVFGVIIIIAGFLMLFAPKKARATLRKAGSTNWINYTEITLRLIPAIAMILYGDFSKLPIAFKVLGWFMLLTSLVLYMIPRIKHHHFSMKAADILQPLYWQLLAPFAFLLGGLIIYNVI